MVLGEISFFMKQETLWTQEFLGMSCSNFFQFMSQYIMIAALPIFIMDQLGGGEIEAGLAMTSFQIGTGIRQRFAGRWIDRIHKGKLMLGTTVAFLLVMTGLISPHRCSWYFFCDFCRALCLQWGTTAAATLAALLLPLSRKGEGIGYFAVSTNLAMVLGPLLGLVIIAYGPVWCKGAVYLFDGTCSFDHLGQQSKTVGDGYRFAICGYA